VDEVCSRRDSMYERVGESGRTNHLQGGNTKHEPKRSQDDALATFGPFGFLGFDDSVARWSGIHNGSSLLAVSIRAEGADEGAEQAFDVVGRACAGFEELAAKGASELGAVLTRDLALLGLVRFVAYEDVGGILAFDAKHALAEDLEAVKRAPRRDRVDEDKTLAFPNPLITEGSIFLLTGGVNDLDKAHAIIDERLLPIRILYSRIVRLDKTSKHVLDGECGLADTTIA